MRWSGRIARRSLVRGKLDKTLIIDTLLPDKPERIPWGGHLGVAMLQGVIAEIESAATSLVFTNTRSQAEIWYKELLTARPDWAGIIALHHASMERATRDWVENGLKTGALKAVVCTSSLDLGVDFLPVERVLQIGSPKGVARLLQRAGRSGHAPGRPSRITIVPSHSLELVESAAAQRAVREGRIEAQTSPDAPLDALAQHLVTIALGGGFRPDELLTEVRDTVAYERLSDADWRWALDFVRHGGPTLAVYPDFKRVEPDKDGVWRMPSARLAMIHRFNIGTITADAGLTVQYGPTPPGARLGVGGGEFCREAQTRRQILVRRQAAGTGAGARSDRLCAAGARRTGDDSALGRRALSALDHARRRDGRTDGRGRARRLRRAGDAGRAAAARTAGPLVGAADAGNPARRDAENAATAGTCFSIRSPAATCISASRA